MSDQTPNIITQPAVKAAAAWSGVGFAEWLRVIGITTWGDAAAAAAFAYSAILIAEWLYKKLIVRRRLRRCQAEQESRHE